MFYKNTYMYHHFLQLVQLLITIFTHKKFQKNYVSAMSTTVHNSVKNYYLCVKNVHAFKE